MPFESHHPPGRRAEVEALLRDTDLMLIEIAARTGVNRHTVSTWNARSPWRRQPRTARKFLATWPAARRAALARLYAEPGLDPGDLAEAAGVAREAAAELFAALGLRRPDANDRAIDHEAHDALPPPSAGGGGSRGSRRRSATPESFPSEGGPVSHDTEIDPPTLRAHLRAHIARQIAAFDAALRGEGAAVIDSARVLRDLGGLKRLFDELVREDGAEAEDGPEPDLPALREAIARRLAACGGAGDAPGLPGDPAAADAGGAGG